MVRKQEKIRWYMMSVAYQNWKNCRWRDSAFQIEEYNLIFDVVEWKLFEKALKKPDGKAGNPETFHTILQGCH